MGYFGLRKLTGVSYDMSHDGAWWTKWWEENKMEYPEVARDLPIPDFTREVAEGRGKTKQAKVKAALADVVDVPSTDLLAGGDRNKRYFLIGPLKGATPPAGGYKLAIVIPGGDGSGKFNPFVRRILKNALGKEWIIAEPVAFKWHMFQRVVWPTKIKPALGQQFSTEGFVEAVIADVKKRQPITSKHIVILTWSSSGPAAYAISLQPKKSVTGSYIAMSVFRPDWFPPITNAKGHRYVIDHSPEDQICPFSQAEKAVAELRKVSAEVKFTQYQGGHGWHGDLYTRIREGMNWLTRP